MVTAEIPLPSFLPVYFVALHCLILSHYLALFLVFLSLSNLGQSTFLSIFHSRLRFSFLLSYILHLRCSFHLYFSVCLYFLICRRLLSLLFLISLTLPLFIPLLVSMALFPSFYPSTPPSKSVVLLI